LQTDLAVNYIIEDLNGSYNVKTPANLDIQSKNEGLSN
jgi:hypothetical protein